MKICYIVAMEAEAKPFVEKFGVEKVENAFGELPCQLYSHRLSEDNALYIVVNGKQHGSSLIGCEAASVTTLKAIEELRPDLIINSGTCGAFIKNGAEIGKVYVGNGVMFHDRRVMGDDKWYTQSIGNYRLSDRSAEIAAALGMPMGKVTTGSSLDIQPCDLEVMEQHGGELKDMEGAAVAFVCSLMNVPCILVKSVTDLIDGGENTFEEFSRNLDHASEELSKANVRIVEYLINH
ncbi:MAG: hypothetical protein NC344_10670 [Bacteroidales bacterium]|nr:hypothetical protein [Bacteroidales bacterium]MCM1148268.1 hypothetical protein [Bacteroidales bacterium]MCM1206591.1 5'-methylthioadenosine nucleosidase [Bacillota bacterium]MCM1510507.1 hypothetical protein [Clostridium sp.]